MRKEPLSEAEQARLRALMQSPAGSPKLFPTELAILTEKQWMKVQAGDHYAYFSGTAQPKPAGWVGLELSERRARVRQVAPLKLKPVRPAFTWVAGTAVRAERGGVAAYGKGLRQAERMLCWLEDQIAQGIIASAKPL